MDKCGSKSAPVGVFDSGVGGLSVLRHIREQLPAENLIYVADSKYVPYGGRSAEFIQQRAHALSRFLIEQNAKAIVVACNTATAAAIAALRASYTLPIIGIEPGVKPAAELTRSGVIGVLATTGTLASDKFYRLVERFSASAQVIIQPCPGLVEQVEQADFDSAQTRALVESYVVPLVERGVDTLVLGCTHYPYLAALIQEVAGPDVRIIDTGPAVAREVRRRLAADDRLGEDAGPGRVRFWSSGGRERLQCLADRLWHETVQVGALPQCFT